MILYKLRFEFVVTKRYDLIEEVYKYSNKRTNDSKVKKQPGNSTY